MKTLLTLMLLGMVACSPPAATSQSGDPDTVAVLRLGMLRDMPVEGTNDEPVLMVMDMPEGVSSLVASNRGDASIYYNKSGGAILGGVGDPTVNAAAIRAVAEAARHKAAMTPVTEFPFPGPDMVRFYVRTPQRVYMAEAPLDDLTSGRSPLSKLFGAGMDVLLPLSELDKNR